MEQTFTLKLTQAEMAIVLEAIGNMPINRAVNAFARIQQQISEQQQPTAPTPAQAAAMTTRANGSGITDVPT